ncbi:hypothetical protein [Nocardioides mangrovi]|uniref:Uncharacterized protein n=1 Tax=Nocardioides mangrovi TaxID=2874580 RepID=A0ABS7U8G0_9ACTN|nr:hypothetical protein [Nocardioides mangrovi]MBZ5737269.1 hypothetical protein [Nocardioides mangrovi]
MSARARWWRRGAAAVVVYVVLEVVLTVLDLDPDPLRLALLVGTYTALVGLVVDALAGDEPVWTVESELHAVRAGGDPRLGRYVALLESHLSAKEDDRALRDRLGVLADQVLRQRHGVGRDDPSAATLLGPELTDLLTGPPRRVAPAQLDRCLTRIEEL